MTTTSSAGTPNSSTNSFPKVYEQALATILRLVLANTGSSGATTEAPLADRASSRFTAATDYVAENLDRKIGLGELASLVALSVRQFAHAVKAVDGRSAYR